MTQKLWWTTLFAFLPSLAFAQPKAEVTWHDTKMKGLTFPLKCHPGDPTRCVLHIKAGEKAPIPGILESYTQQAFIQVKADPVRIQERIDEAVRTAKKQADNDLALERKYRQIDNDAWAEKMKKTEANHAEQLKRVAPAWYEEPVILVPATVVLTIGAVALTAYASGKLRGD